MPAPTVKIVAKPEFADMRIRAGFSQQELANQVGLKRLQIYLLETGARGTTAQRAKMITDALSVKFDDIFQTLRAKGAK